MTSATTLASLLVWKYGSSLARVARIERLKRRHYVNVVTIVWQRESENERGMK